jgi:hypothetical protein
MNQAGFHKGVRRSSGVSVGGPVAVGPDFPHFTLLTSSTLAPDANPTRHPPDLDTGGSSREQQQEKGRKR